MRTPARTLTHSLTHARTRMRTQARPLTHSLTHTHTCTRARTHSVYVSVRAFVCFYVYVCWEGKGGLTAHTLRKTSGAE